MGLSDSEGDRHFPDILSITDHLRPSLRTDWEQQISENNNELAKISQ
jgi:hypothetical protein